MIRFAAARVFGALGLMFGVLVLVFAMVRVTGDPVSLMVAREATVEQRQAFRERYGFDRPLPEQFAAYLGGVFIGDLGQSFSLGLPNTQLILQRLPATLELALAALVLALAIAVPLGLVSGSRPDGALDLLARGLSLIGQTVPGYWLAMVLILVFAVQLRVLPSFGRDGWQSLVLPAAALALGLAGQMVRLIRGSVLEIRRENYIRAAYAKGLHSAAVSARHVLPNLAGPLIAVLGVQFTYLLGGSVYIETVFSWPGLGSLLNNAITSSDFPLVQAITLFLAASVISVSLLADVLHAWADPRVRSG